MYQFTAAIGIPFDPNVFSAGMFTLTWHGVFSVIALIVGVGLAVVERRRLNVDIDRVYNTAMVAVLGGFIGARIVHVADFWSEFTPIQIWDFFRVWEGGVGLWGGILGGWLAGLIFTFLAGYPRETIGRLMDMGAIGMLAGQTVGRIGDIINGEHCSTSTDLPWGWFFTHPDSPGRTCITNSDRFSQGYFPIGTPADTAVHPTVVYEMLWNIVGLVLLYFLRGRLRPYGSMWFVYLAWYAIGRFAIQWLRLDRVHLLGLQEAHIIAIIVLAISIPFIVWKTRFQSKGGEPSGQRTRRRSKAV